MGTVNPRGAHECGALGSAQGCAQSSAVPLVVAHRIERNPDWKVFLNMAAAAGALIHVRSAPQALTRAGGGRQGERPGQVLVHVSQPALARLGLCRNAFSRWGLLVHVTTRSAECSRSQPSPCLWLCASGVGRGLATIPCPPTLHLSSSRRTTVIIKLLT